MYVFKGFCCLLLFTFPLLVTTNARELVESELTSAERMLTCGFECSIENSSTDETDPFPTQTYATTIVTEIVTEGSSKPTVTTEEESTSSVPTTTIHEKTTEVTTEKYTEETTNIYTTDTSTEGANTENDWSSTLSPTTICPPDSSLYSKLDLKTIINDVIKDLDVYQHLNESYYTKAVAVRDKHMANLETFLEWFKDRPNHLKHILAEVAKVRQRITPLVNKLGRYLKQYPELKRDYEENFQKVNSVIKAVTNLKQVCKNRNCILKNSKDIQSRLGQRSDSRYCGTKSYIWEKIKGIISDFQIKYTSQLATRVNDDDTKYLNETENIKNNLKDIALKEFGRTMYDILNLQDEYYHFEELLQTDLRSVVLKIKNNNQNTGSALIALNASIEDLDKYCTTCTPHYGVLRLASLSLAIAEDAEIKNKKSKDMLDELIEQELVQIEAKIEEQYQNMFAELNRNLNHTISPKENVELLKPVQNDVIKLTNAETLELNKLRSEIPKSSTDDLTLLNSKTLELYQSVTNIRTELKEKYDIQ